MYLQQGDVLIKKSKIISGVRINGLTVASGEASGHHHTITTGDADLYENDGVIYIKVKSPSATLTHPEHKPVVIPSGDWEIGIVKEYDHFAEEAKNVTD